MSTTSSAPPAPPERLDRAAELHPLLHERHSPRAFAADPAPTGTELTAVLEAARWAPSWGNAQTSRFVVTRAGTPENEALATTLTERNQRWVRPSVPVLLLAVARTRLEEGKEARYGAYDLGQAAAHLTVQAAALGLAVHQMAGFDRERARVALDVPEDFEPLTVIALGRPGDPHALPDDLRERELAPRRRTPLGEVAFAGRWGEPWRPA